MQVQNFIQMVEVQFGTKVKVIRIDNCVEFLMPQYYAMKGIVHQMSYPETPQQNDRVERRHQHILNVSRALMIQSKVPKCFWTHSVLHAVYIINRVPTPLLNGKSPFECLFGSALNLKELRVFRSLCYASTNVINPRNA